MLPKVCFLPNLLTHIDFDIVHQGLDLLHRAEQSIMSQVGGRRGSNADYLYNLYLILDSIYQTLKHIKGEE